MRWIAATSILLVTALSGSVSARPVQVFKPEELSAKAEVICNGVVIDVSNTGQAGMVHDSPIEYWQAHIKVLSASRGVPPREITLRFPQLKRDASTPPIVNGPQQIHLVPQNRYRFYLRSRSNLYVGVLDGSYDDSGSVESLYPNEPDQSPPLLKDEALRLAREYAAKLQIGGKRGEESVESVYSPCPWGAGPEWVMLFYYGSQVTYPTATSAAMVIVQADRTIESRSWVGAEFPRSGSAITSNDIGASARLAYDAGSGWIKELHGAVTKVEPDTITFHSTFSEPDRKQDETEVISRKAITGFQKLRSSSE